MRTFYVLSLTNWSHTADQDVTFGLDLWPLYLKIQAQVTRDTKNILRNVNFLYFLS